MTLNNDEVKLFTADEEDSENTIESLESIEQTVAELKKKIAELADDPVPAETEETVCTCEEPAEEACCCESETSAPCCCEEKDAESCCCEAEEKCCCETAEEPCCCEEPVEEPCCKAEEECCCAEQAEGTCCCEETAEPECECAAEKGSETVEKIAKLTEQAVETAGEVLADLGKKAEEVVNQNEDLKKTVDYIKANAVKAVEAAKGVIDGMKQEPKLQEVTRNAQEMLNKAAAVAGEKAKQAEEFVKSHVDEEKSAELLKKLDEAAQKLSENTKKAVLKADEIYNKPEVQEALVKVRSAAADIGKLAEDALNSLLKKSAPAENNAEDGEKPEEGSEE